MIDEKKLIDEIDRLREKYDEMCGSAQMNEEYGMEMMYAGKVTGLHEIKKFIMNQPKVGEWIPCSERFPDDGDCRFYMCTVENHEEDPPMFCQYEEGYGFGFWNDIYDEHTLGFVDSEFKTNEELGYEKVVAWMPLPEPYKGE
ncbi:DUF551 domain-containing protein [Faecalicatena contorta]|uniref:DUF551 domain-containing protein n=1 Tax=Faecalicatena contorta TaxID=39482 RepID=UPI001F46867E|nr:DUF551 domain-containing protein [Faecalicatena contorta]MCF2555557.1 DUF551 domain-containing protein [Faecalicatena contorta]